MRNLSLQKGDSSSSEDELLNYLDNILEIATRQSHRASALSEMSDHGDDDHENGNPNGTVNSQEPRNQQIPQNQQLPPTPGIQNLPGQGIPQEGVASANLLNTML